MMPVPRVSVRNRERKPIKPRDGTANSNRTRLEPPWVILVILPLRMASSCDTTPIKSSRPQRHTSRAARESVVLVSFFVRAAGGESAHTPTQKKSLGKNKNQYFSP